MKMFLLLGAILMLIFGCSTLIYPTHPNVSSIEQVENSDAKALLQQLDSLDSVLALEVCRLPEFQAEVENFKSWLLPGLWI
jgi:hypothetical protein